MTVDIDFWARMARSADVAAGRVPPGRWDDLGPDEQDVYRRAVGGLGGAWLDSRGVTAIRRERVRQIAEERFSAEYDDRHSDGELVEAALAYATLAVMQLVRGDAHRMLDRYPPLTGFCWPDGFEWKPAATVRDNLVKAGALIAAEVDRLDRLESDPFGTTCIDCGKAIDDSRPYSASADGNLIHNDCGDPLAAEDGVIDR